MPGWMKAFARRCRLTEQDPGGKQTCWWHHAPGGSQCTHGASCKMWHGCPVWLPNDGGICGANHTAENHPGAPYGGKYTPQ